MSTQQSPKVGDLVSCELIRGVPVMGRITEFEGCSFIRAAVDLTDACPDWYTRHTGHPYFPVGELTPATYREVLAAARAYVTDDPRPTVEGFYKRMGGGEMPGHLGALMIIKGVNTP